MASLCYVPRAASSSFPCGGLIAGSLVGGCFWEQVNETTYRPHVLPLETAGCTDFQVETESRHCLVTYRPGETPTPPGQSLRECFDLHTCLVLTCDDLHLTDDDDGDS